MQFKRVAYTSLAAIDLAEAQMLDIRAASQDLNGIDGISGLLIFNGTHFLQWIEGPPVAIDDLMVRLRSDSRHGAFEVREEGLSDERLFGDWTMELVRVRSRVLGMREDLSLQLPPGLPEPLRRRILTMAEEVAAEVQI